MAFSFHSLADEMRSNLNRLAQISTECLPAGPVGMVESRDRLNGVII